MRIFQWLAVWLSIGISSVVTGQEVAGKKKVQELLALKEKIDIQLDIEYAKAGDLSLKLDI